MHDSVINKLLDEVQGKKGRQAQVVAEVLIRRWLESIDQKDIIIQELIEETARLTKQIKNSKVDTDQLVYEID